jgi:2-polyprenyl-3-methyl-5-hydroxy-6-metoxy-1,4-benzoquinol methylase
MARRTPGIEDVQRYWNNRPCNIRHSRQEVGTADYFNEVEARKYRIEPHIVDFADFSRWRGKRVLEIGCGIGTDTINFAKAGAWVTAVDLSDESLALTKKRAEVFGLTNIKFYCADAEKLTATVPVEFYDLIYSFGVIHHTPRPQAVIRQIRNYMGPESTLKIMVYNRLSWKVLWILLIYGKGAFWKLDKLIAQNSEAQTGCPVTFTYTKQSARELLQGFSITDCRIDHIFPYKISEYTNYRYKKAWYFRYIPSRIFRWMESHWGWHLLLTARLHQ